jgi:hypothetical protein
LSNSRDIIPIRPTTNQILCPQNNPSVMAGKAWIWY